jgi:hypothetical protein
MKKIFSLIVLMILFAVIMNAQYNVLGGRR